jgi:hypothetical protein
MGICWYCHWGWPKAIRDIYDQALKKINGNQSALYYGPAHVVWADENFDLAQSCLDSFDEYSKELSEEEKIVVRWSLEQLLLLPENIINSEPKDYDGEHPENYPPPSNIEWEKKQNAPE